MSSTYNVTPITRDALVREYIEHRSKRDHEVERLDEEMSILHYDHLSSGNKHEGFKTLSVDEKPFNNYMDDLSFFHQAGNGVKQFLAPREVFKQLLLDFTQLVHSTVNKLVFKKDHQSNLSSVVHSGTASTPPFSSISDVAPISANNQLITFQSATDGITEPYLDENRKPFPIWKFRRCLLYSLRSKRWRSMNQSSSPLSKYYFNLRRSLLRQLKLYHLSKAITRESDNKLLLTESRKRGRKNGKNVINKLDDVQPVLPHEVAQKLLRLCCTPLRHVPTSLYVSLSTNSTSSVYNESTQGDVDSSGGGGRMSQFSVQGMKWSVVDWSGFNKKLKLKAVPNNNIKQSKRKQRERDRKEKLLVERIAKNATMVPKSRVRISGKIDVVAVALSRLLLTVAHRLEVEGEGGMATLEAERERLFMTSRCRHPRHLPGMSCINCDLAQLPNGTFFPSALMGGARRLVKVHELMEFIVAKLDIIRHRINQLQTRASLLHRHATIAAASFIQQQWRLRRLRVQLLSVERKLNLSSNRFRKQRIEKLIRDVYFGDCSFSGGFGGYPSYSECGASRMYRMCSMRRQEQLSANQLADRYFDMPKETEIVLSSRRLKMSLGTKQALDRFIHFVMLKVNTKRQARSYAKKRDTELAIRKMELAKIAEARAAAEANLSVEDYRLMLKKQEMLRRKKEFEALLNKKSAAVEYFECSKPQCRVKKRNDNGQWQFVPKSFLDEARYRMHMQLHKNEERAEKERKFDRMELLKERTNHEESFLEQLAIKRQERLEAEKRREVAEALVKAEEMEEQEQLSRHPKRFGSRRKHSEKVSSHLHPSALEAQNRQVAMFTHAEQLRMESEQDKNLHFRCDMLVGANNSNHLDLNLKALVPQERDPYKSRSLAPVAPFTKNMLLNQGDVSHRANKAKSEGKLGEGGVVIRQTKVPLLTGSKLSRESLPYLELLHSSLLPVANQSESGVEDRLASFTVLSNVVNRIGTASICDVSLGQPIESLRGQLGIAVESIASSFSPVHALIRVEMDDSESVVVSVYDNHFSAAGSAGVWVLGMAGIRAAPPTKQYHSIEKRPEARVYDGDKLMLALRSSSCVSHQQPSPHTSSTVAMYRVYHLVYSVHIPKNKMMFGGNHVIKEQKDSIDLLVDG